MDLTQKPFACTMNGCDMTFTNEDHLNWHTKKHELMLNLGLAYKNSDTADQTPTPTRFIRNCEEVGLFQDLQNVNPFDETFKKAIESGRSWHIPQEPKQTNDDTLHTPHIFPPVETEQTVKFTNETVDVHPPNEFCFVSVPIDLSDDEYDSDQTHDLVINTSGSDNEIENNSTNIPQKSNDKQRTNGVQSNKTKQIVQSKSNNIKEKNWEDAEEREKLRAMNRAAQSRCRRRKQQQHQRMEEDLKRYKDENAELMRENQIFKYKFAALKDLIIKARNNRKVKHPILNEVERILNSVVTLQNKVPISPKTRRRDIAPITATTKLPIVKPTTTTNIPIVPAPAPIRPTTIPPVATKPVLIQVVGAVDQVAVSVVPK